MLYPKAAHNVASRHDTHYSWYNKQVTVYDAHSGFLSSFKAHSQDSHLQVFKETIPRFPILRIKRWWFYSIGNNLWQSEGSRAHIGQQNTMPYWIHSLAVQLNSGQKFLFYFMHCISETFHNTLHEEYAWFHMSGRVACSKGSVFPWPSQCLSVCVKSHQLQLKQLCSSH